MSIITIVVESESGVFFVTSPDVPQLFIAVTLATDIPGALAHLGYVANPQPKQGTR
jgi:hypothetical protein